MKRSRIKKAELFHIIFAKETIWRLEMLGDAHMVLLFSRVFRDNGFDRGIIRDLNQAAPVTIDLGNGPIACASFGSIQDGKLSYRPLHRRSDCNALVGGIDLASIKSIKLMTK
jgi:hypothetical protein